MDGLVAIATHHSLSLLSPNITPLVERLHWSANSSSYNSQLVHDPFYQCYQSILPVSWTFSIGSWFYKTDLTCGTPQYHDSGPSPLAISWIFQTNSINLFALCGFCILSFSFPLFRILCLLIVRWFMFVLCSPRILMMVYKQSLQTWSKVE